MSDLFIAVLNMSLTASYVALAVIIVRLLLRKAPKIFSYAIWGVLLFRLVCPISFESPLSLIPGETAAISRDMDLSSQNPAIRAGIGIVGTVNQSINYSLPTVGSAANVNLMGFVKEIAAAIWLLGIAALLCYSLLSYFKLRRRLSTATLVKDNIFETDRIQTPFVLGFIKPRIYIPTGLDQKEVTYIVKHEQVHIKRRDYLIKPAAFLALVLHWFNPLMWISYFLMVKDMEMSCDESVMRQTNADIRASYSNSLLTLSVKQSGLLSPLAFGESNAKSRIKNVINYKRPAFWVSVVAVVLVVTASLGLLANPLKDDLYENDKTGNVSWISLLTHKIIDGFNSSVSNVGGVDEPIPVIIEKNLSTILSSPKESSNPQDYINAHQNEYENILKLGDEALNYLLLQFGNGQDPFAEAKGKGVRANNDLRGHIMMQLCKDILGDRNNVTDETLSPEAWFSQLSIYEETILPNLFYDGGNPIEKLVYDTEIDKNFNPYRGGFVVVAPKIHAYYEEGSKLKVFVTTYYGNYHLYDKVVSLDGAGVVPAAITYVKDKNGNYILEEYKQAMDGSYFAKSIEDFCTMPVSGKKIAGLANKILDHYGNYGDIVTLHRENLIRHLKTNNQEEIKLKSPSGEIIPLT